MDWDFLLACLGSGTDGTTNKVVFHPSIGKIRDKIIKKFITFSPFSDITLIYLNETYHSKLFDIKISKSFFYSTFKS